VGAKAGRGGRQHSGVVQVEAGRLMWSRWSSCARWAINHAACTADLFDYYFILLITPDPVENITKL
jgi:hypothetical protein